MKQNLKLIFLLIIVNLIFFSCYPQKEKNMKWNSLTPEEERVIIHKGTERAFSGKYADHKEKGIFTCKRCDAPLFSSEDKFESHCGWPSFDDEIKGAVKRVPDPDGIRTEIICANCGGHLGHVFEGEGFTRKNLRHCVNSVSMNFIAGAAEAEKKYHKAVFASGCFWGSEYYFSKAEGVISTTVGYTGGTKENPTYKEVCTGTTGHFEAVEIEYDPEKTDYEALARLYFETHDPTQKDGQGPDIGTQYRSAIFFMDESQKEIAGKLIRILREKGYDVVTQLLPAGKFWKAEDYHQDYYEKTGGNPYCHFYRKKF